MTNHFHYSIKEQESIAARNGAMALLIVVTGALIVGLACLWTQWDRVYEVMR